jgi:hypothetical protein
MMLVLRFLLKSLVFALLTRLLGAFAPLLRRVIRLVWR